MKEPKNKFTEITSAQFREILKHPDVIARANKVLRQAQMDDMVGFIRDGVITEKEYVEEYKGRYLNPDGGDSFCQYLAATLYESMKDSGYFITMQEDMLKDREKITKRFGLKIMSIKEMVEKEETDERLDEKGSRGQRKEDSGK